MIKIFHNPRCKKSREGLEILEKSGKEFKVINYLEDVPSKLELSKIVAKLNIHAEELVRKNEAIWKENFKGKEFSNEQLIEIMIANPKLIERPIVINGQKALIGRPPKNILTII